MSTARLETFTDGECTVDGGANKARTGTEQLGQCAGANTSEDVRLPQPVLRRGIAGAFKEALHCVRVHVRHPVLVAVDGHAPLPSIHSK